MRIKRQKNQYRQSWEKASFYAIYETTDGLMRMVAAYELKSDAVLHVAGKPTKNEPIR